MKLLVVEDDQNLVDSWRRDVNDFNEDPDKDVEFVMDVAQNLEEAETHLRNQRYNYVVADLRIPTDGTPGAQGEAQNGNALISDIANRYPIVLAVMSGHPGELTEPNGVKLSTFVKGNNSNQDVLDWLYQGKDLSLSMERLMDETQALMASFLHRSISTRWQRSWKDHITPDELKHVVLRMGFAYLSEVMTHSPAYSQQFHPEEFYLVPPIRERLHTGDMLEQNGQVYVVLSPPCDMANRNYPANILVAKCDRCDQSDKIADEWKAYFAATKRSDIRDNIRKFINQNLGPAVHFIPPLEDKGPWIVSFKDISTLDSGKVEELIAARFGAVSPYFLSNLLNRFASHIGRIGQPNLGPDFTNEAIKKAIPAVPPVAEIPAAATQ